MFIPSTEVIGLGEYDFVQHRSRIVVLSRIHLEANGLQSLEWSFSLQSLTEETVNGRIYLPRMTPGALVNFPTAGFHFGRT
jgi:hypothetical protein